MSPSMRPLNFGQTYYPGRPYAPIVPMASIPTTTNPAMAVINNENPQEASPLNSAKPLHAHDYALAPIKAFKDEHEQRHELAQESKGATMISEMNKHQLGEQLSTGPTTQPKPVSNYQPQPLGAPVPTA